MKQIAALLLSAVALLTFTTGAYSADRWGWATVSEPTLWPAMHEDAWVPVGALDHYANGAARIKVVPLPVEAAAAKAPGALAAALPQLGEAIDAIRTVVAEDPALLTNLEARGFKLTDVVGLANSASGEVTVFVATAA